MASACNSSCVVNDIVSRIQPVRATYVNLYKWPESDAEFVRSVSFDKRQAGGRSSFHHHHHHHSVSFRHHRSVSFDFIDGGGGGSFRHGHPAVVESVSCRQLYLRSYTFSRKENLPERTKKCLDRVRQRVSTACRHGERKMESDFHGGGGKGKKKMKKKKCVGFGISAKKASCAAVSAVFRRLLSCTTKVDVVG